MTDLIEMMKPVGTEEGIRYKTYPAQDERVVRVLRKVVRGLCHHHNILTPVSEKQVWVDVLKYAVPPEWIAQVQHHHREEDIVEYWYETMTQDDVSSAWLITFFKEISFVALVSASEAGFGEDESG